MKISSPFKQHLVFVAAILVFCLLSGCTSPDPTTPVATSPLVNTAVPQRPTNTPPATPVPSMGYAVDPWSEEAEEVIEWGEEIPIEQVVELARSEDLAEIQWHVLPNVIRVVMQDGSLYHFNNANIGIDLVTKLNDAGINTGKNGITLRYSFCN